MGMDGQVVLTSFVYEMDAQMLVLELQAEGIEAAIRKDDCGGMRPLINNERGVEVLVSKADLPRALEIAELCRAEREEVAAENQTRRRISKVELISVAVLCIAIGWAVHWLYMKQNYFLEEVELDRNNDGLVDEQWNYDEQGIIRSGLGDDNFDGKWDQWYTYVDGRLALYEIDSDFNGIVDERVTYQNSVMVRSEVRPNNAEKPSRIYLYRHGILWKEQIDTNQDGRMDLEITYDPFGGIETNQPIPRDANGIE
ncbi:hypothetical protein P4C99_20275 [Pontiellaceae bacterium B1224]|nr:hypothetical protein [Pontiellaceae bacterium B1224]